MSGEYESALRLAIATAAALGAWLVLLGVLVVATRPRSPDPGPTTMDLGSEPPAIVNLITSRWRLGHEAVPATLLDLAGRRVVDIEETEPDRYIVRLKGKVPADLTSYERQVLTHVAGLAADGVVPCEALTTGPEDASKRWWKTFERSVRDHARALGLSRSRWRGAQLVLLGLVALVPAGLAGAAVAALPDTGETSEGDPVFVFIGVAVGVWWALFAAPLALRRERDTDAGLEVARRWLGVREHLHDDDIFSDLPPAAVAVWDRYIAYGAALDVSVAAVRALPLGTESEYEAWSSYGGSWRVVRIRYPVRFPPGWGRHPGLVVWLGAVWSGVAVSVLARAVPALLDQRDDIVDTVAVGPQVSWWDTAITGVAVGLWVIFGFMLVRALAMVVLGASDLFAREEVEGRILRVRLREKKPPLIAVDDAKHDDVRAWVVRHAAGYLGRGNDIRATITPRLAYVREFEVTRAVSSPASSSPELQQALEKVEAVTGLLRHIPGLRGIAHTMMTAIASSAAMAETQPGTLSPLDGLDVGWVATVAGRALHDVTAAEPNTVGLAAMGGDGEAAVLADDGKGRLVLARWGNVEAFDRVGAMLPKFLGRAVPGVGTEAVWFARSTLLARDADSTVMVSLALGLDDDAAALAVAEPLAQRFLAPFS